MAKIINRHRQRDMNLVSPFRCPSAAKCGIFMFVRFGLVQGGFCFIFVYSYIMCIHICIIYIRTYSWPPESYLKRERNVRQICSITDSFHRHKPLPCYSITIRNIWSSGEMLQISSSYKRTLCVCVCVSVHFFFHSPHKCPIT